MEASSGNHVYFNTKGTIHPVMYGMMEDCCKDKPE